MGGLARAGRDWARDIAVAAAVGGFVGVLGPFGNYLAGSILVRIAYWGGLFALGGVLYGAAVRLAHRLARPGPAPAWLLLAMLLAASGPMALVSALVARRLWPAVGETPPLVWYLQCVALSVPLAAVYERLRRRGRPAPATESAPAQRFGRDVLCLQMEDHYVRVHTPQGSQLVLMPMSQAIRCTQAPGVQVHRSWWVARSAVAGVVRDGRNLRIRLLNGLEAPVARRAVARLRAEGLIAG